MFFHKYFTSRTTVDSEKSKATTKRKSRRGGEGDGLSSDSEESIADAGIAETGEDFDEDALAAAMEEEVGQDSDKDDESEDDEMEDQIWKAMKKSMPKESGDAELLDDDNDDSEGVVDEEDKDLAAYDYSDSDDEEQKTHYKSPFDDEDLGDDDDGFLEEDDDLVDSDADIPLYGSDDEAEDENAASNKGGKRAENKNKKRKLKHLPLFATADDYAKLLGGSDDEDI